MKACEAETSKVGQDYYTALSASSPAAAKGPAAGKGAAPAKGKAAKEEAATPVEVGRKHARNNISSHPMVVVGVMVVVMVVVMETCNIQFCSCTPQAVLVTQDPAPAAFHESAHADVHRCTCSGQAACAPMFAPLLTLLEARFHLIQHTQPVSTYITVYICADTTVLPQLVMYEHTASVLVADCANIEFCTITDH